MSKIARELRHAVRRLARSPGFAAASVTTLALGIGATAAAYSLVHSIVIRPLPYPESERLVWLDHAGPGVGAERGLGMTDGLFVHYAERARTLENVAIWERVDVTLGGDEPERLRAASTTSSLFAALGARPAIGRPLAEGDVEAGPRAIVIGHALWTRRFGADSGVLGRVVPLDGVPVEIVGVMPRDFSFPGPEVALWIPDRVPPTTDFGGFSREGIARLSPGVSRADAELELRALIPEAAERFGGRRLVEEARLAPLLPSLKTHVVRDAERTLWILLGSVAFLLVLAGANVANLLLVRAEGRRRDAALRRALGASRLDVAGHFLSEGLVLAGAGSALGLGIAALAARALVAFGPGRLPRLSEVAVRPAAFLLVLGILLCATLAFGLLPTLRRAPSLASAIGSGGPGGRGGTAGGRGRDALVALQVALALVLLVATGLMARSFLHLTTLDPGFSAERVLTFHVGLPSASYPDRQAAVALHREALQRMGALPGVRVAGATTCLPLCGSWNGNQLSVQGRPDDPGRTPRVVAVRRVSEGYFAALRVRLLRGRLPTGRDLDSGSGAAVISRELARAYWPDADPIGARFQPGSPEGDWYAVVGIVDDTPIRGLADRPPPTAYLPLVHGTDREASPLELAYALRTSGRPQSALPAAREIVRSLDPEVPLSRVATMEALVAESNVSTAFATAALALAAGMGLLLGLVGIYGVVAYSVARRTREIGIRMALGARSGQVAGAVLARGAKVAGAGLVVGLVGALVLTRVMRSLLFGVSPTDPVTFAAVPALLLAVALAATWLPARRAARIDPARTLRAE